MGITIRLSTLALSLVAVAAFGAEAQQMSAVTQLGWLRNGEYAPIMMAEAKGFFKEEGIDHKIVDGGPGKNPIPIVAVGQAQFGLATNGMALVTARLAKDPVDVVAVGTLFQQAPTAYLTIAAPGAPPPKPKDMEGKTVGTQAGTEFLFHAFAKKNGLDESKVKVVTAQATVEPLMVGKMDYFLGWIVNQTYQIEQEAAKADAPPTVKGKTWQALRLSDLGIAHLHRRDLHLGRHAQEESRAGEALPARGAEGHAVRASTIPTRRSRSSPSSRARSRTPRSSPGASRSRTRCSRATTRKKNGPLAMDPAVWTADDRLPEGRRTDPEDHPGVRGHDQRVLRQEVDVDVSRPRRSRDPRRRVMIGAILTSVASAHLPGGG